MRNLKLTSLSHIKLMVVEDDVAQLNVIKAILAASGAIDIVAVTSATDAARILATQATKVDCIICDHRLGDISGLELLQKIRSGQNPFIARDVRFIMVTGYSDLSLVKGAAGLDVSGFVLKPVETAKLLNAVQIAMAQKQQLKSPKIYAAMKLSDI